MIEMNVPLVLANKQIMKFKKFEHSTIRDPKNAGKTCNIGTLTFEVYNEGNNFLQLQTINILPDEWDEFWDSFNTGTAYYLWLKKAKNMQIDVADSEGEFKNGEKEE